MIDFRRWHPAQIYTMFGSEKVSERNENCRFQPAYVRKASGSGCNPGGVSCRMALDSSNRFYQYLTLSTYSFIKNVSLEPLGTRTRTCLLPHDSLSSLTM